MLISLYLYIAYANTFWISDEKERVTGSPKVKGDSLDKQAEEQDMTSKLTESLWEYPPSSSGRPICLLTKPSLRTSTYARGTVVAVGTLSNHSVTLRVTSIKPFLQFVPSVALCVH